MNYENILVPLLVVSFQKYLGVYSFILLSLLPILKLINFAKYFKKSIICKVYKENINGGGSRIYDFISIALNANVNENLAVSEEIVTKDAIYKCKNFKIKKVLPKYSLIKGYSCMIYNCRVEYNEEEIKKNMVKFFLITAKNKEALDKFFIDIEDNIKSFYKSKDTNNKKTVYQNYLSDRSVNTSSINVNKNFNNLFLEKDVEEKIKTLVDSLKNKDKFNLFGIPRVYLYTAFLEQERLQLFLQLQWI